MRLLVTECTANSGKTSRYPPSPLPQARLVENLHLVVVLPLSLPAQTFLPTARPIPLHPPPPQVRLVERLHLDFVRAGARFDAPSQRRYSEIMEKLAELETEFSQVKRGEVTGWRWWRQ